MVEDWQLRLETLSLIPSNSWVYFLPFPPVIDCDVVAMVM